MTPPDERPYRLVLVRHAKAAAAGTDDAARPLQQRGERDAEAAGRWLASRGVVPDRVVVSPARRAGRTWTLVATELSAAPDPTTDGRVYDNTVDDLLTVIGETPPGLRTVVVVGHNPSVQGLALLLDGGRSRDLAGKYPTMGIAVFVVRTGWARLGPGTGTLEIFAVPRSTGP